jgi:hypothetical protein
MADKSGAHQYGPVLSPMEEVPGSGHDPAGDCIENGVPGYPKGTERKADEVTFYQGGNFGKFKRD